MQMSLLNMKPVLIYNRKEPYGKASLRLFFLPIFVWLNAFYVYNVIPVIFDSKGSA